MVPLHIAPILNVSNIPQTVRWFEQLGWREAWAWGDPPTFAAVTAGPFEIFLCENGQGGRGEHGAWMSIWVDDVDSIHARCVERGLDITLPPADMPWNVREFHVRHPDGHIFRVTKSLEED